MTSLRTLTDTVRDFERDLAPGSETSLLGPYCEAMRRLTGLLPYQDSDEDPSVPEAEAHYWITQYLALTIACAHYDAEVAELAAGDTLDTDEPIAWMTGAGSIHDDIDDYPIPMRYEGDPNDLAQEVRRQYRALVEEEARY